MQKYAAFLRAVNVSGTGKLPMTELKKMCEDLGFEGVKTYIASGNVIFKCDLEPKLIQAALDSKLRDFFGKSIGVYVRNFDEIKHIIHDNPLKNFEPNRVIISILDDMPINVMDGVKNHKNERIIAKNNVIYTYYGDGMGSSKLSAPWHKISTGRNVNTISKLLELMDQM